MNDSQKKELIKKLDNCEKFSKLPRNERLLKEPYKTLAVSFANKIYSKIFREGISATASTFFGEKMTVDLPEGGNIYAFHILEGDAEVRMTKFLIKNLQPDSVFFDLRANCGYYSLLGATIADKGSIHAFEPSPSTEKILSKNAKGKANIIVNKKAVSNKDGYSDFMEFPARYSTSSTLRPDLFKDKLWAKRFVHANAKIEKVETITLDSYCAEKKIGPDFIKIDVEGNEDNVIAGTRETLEKSRPTVIMEVWDGVRLNNSAHLRAAKMLRGQGYESYLINDEGGLTRTDNLTELCVRKNEDSDNVVFKYKKNFDLMV